VIECASGTYVRSLIADLGDAYCLELRRTRIGPFSVEHAWTAPADASSVPVVGLAHALGFLPSVTLSGEDARRAAHGAPVADPRAAAPAGDADDVVRLLDGEGLIALARRDPASGLLRTIVSLRGGSR
jgi:tRNA pseudouridine55 synthase